MKQVFLSTTTELKEIDTLESGTWINLVNPSQSESTEISNAPLTLILRTYEHPLTQRKCLVLPSKMNIP